MENRKNKQLNLNEKPKYSNEELEALKKFVNVVKNDEQREILACWGNHSDYSKGY